ncbi:MULTISPECIES: GMC oxidoreductase [unclassified Microbacterium]|uniref:GMC oxidoreductase n=1 Tax=unclassified Microbacterium TaxID=2609290 RepID=UPI000CFCC4D4|nr:MULTISPECIES: GMC family oxidoreductase [unclassified Microbacterium]PQZ60957.1 cholesterol oxidase [Microbacterium sp. MYb43]PQZ82166.1 cholesterol oxidase [Microbacterium sp. MYb40]PRB24132.1 cholesterol oxidase [Microbacterium sp. MYb54]PRB30963.1 cholesterol oxidase [Microbacterium sp. MYb50]PRB70614.1 cholesterol oxidase [Microbacterium sp. MYb24]
MAEFDEDVVIVGSGFGGSVAALRLVEKGYRVRVYEAGRRFEDDDFAKTSWNLRRYLWAPAIGCYGVQRIHRLPDVMILAGAGVGGGSLNYANTLYQPGAAFFQDPQWRGIADWESELSPHYATAKRMLGVVEHYPHTGPVERIMAGAADDLGVGATFRHAPVGVWFGKPGERTPDPFFGGEGPDRTGCTLCGNCMVGCRVGAKNTLMKNYLALAERRGVEIEALRTVSEVRELAGGGFAVTTQRSGAWFRHAPRTVTAAQVVLAAGTWGTQQLLHRMKESGALPRISDAVGRLTRTNSEALDGAVATKVPESLQLARGVAITTSFHVDDRTHVENVRYGPGSNLMGALATVLVPGDRRLGARLGSLLTQVVRSPVRQFRLGNLRRWSERGIIALVMQTADNSLTLSLRRRFGRLVMTSTQGHGEPNPSYLPQAHTAAAAIAARVQHEGGVSAQARGSWPEVFGIPLTAHFLGGAVISASPEEGVIDAYHRVWGHPGLHVVDGASVPANPGVNPSLTITALAERALSYWPRVDEADSRPSQ